MKRFAKVVPGWDCIYGACSVPGCPGKMGRYRGQYAGHGIHCDEWICGVLEGDRLLELVVYTDTYPATIPAEHWAPCRRCGHAKHDNRDTACGFVAPPTSAAEDPCNCPGEPLDKRVRGNFMTLHRVKERLPSETDGDLKGRLGNFSRVLSTDDLVCVECDGGAFDFARKTFRAHGDPNKPEQPEALWEALEATLKRWTRSS